VLATIDPRDLQVELAKAQAHLAKVQRDAVAAKNVVVYAARNYSAVNENASGSIAQSENAITKAEAGIQAAQADVALAKQKLIEREAELHKANLDLDRYTALAKERAVTLESLDTARKDYDVALAARDAAVEAVGQANSRLNQAYADLKISKSQLVNAKAQSLQADAADAQISVNSEQQASSEATIKEAQADVQIARLRLSYTKIVAPVAGTVGKKTVEEGQRIQPGTPLLAVVSSDKWIVANFKETQLKKMRVGQKVKIAVDAFGDRKFNGYVDSFSPASGASFALLPPDNATGNFTKIVQRVPVKILFDHGSLGEFDQLIAPGMSCDVKVWVR
jgi:membrane fusion protein (multidrug efflux system)